MPSLTRAALIGLGAALLVYSVVAGAVLWLPFAAFLMGAGNIVKSAPPGARRRSREGGWEIQESKPPWEQRVDTVTQAYMNRDPLDPTSTSEFIMGVAATTDEPEAFYGNTAEGRITQMRVNLETMYRQRGESMPMPTLDHRLAWAENEARHRFRRPMPLTTTGRSPKMHSSSRSAAPDRPRD